MFSSVSVADRHEINQGHCKRWISSNQQHANGFLFLAFGFYQLLMCSKKKKASFQDLITQSHFFRFRKPENIQEKLDKTQKCYLLLVDRLLATPQMFELKLGAMVSSFHTYTLV